MVLKLDTNSNNFAEILALINDKGQLSKEFNRLNELNHNQEYEGTKILGYSLDSHQFVVDDKRPFSFFLQLVNLNLVLGTDFPKTETDFSNKLLQQIKKIYNLTIDNDRNEILQKLLFREISFTDLGINTVKAILYHNRENFLDNYDDGRCDTTIGQTECIEQIFTDLSNEDKEIKYDFLDSLAKKDFKQLELPIPISSNASLVKRLGNILRLDKKAYMTIIEDNVIDRQKFQNETDFMELIEPMFADYFREPKIIQYVKDNMEDIFNKKSSLDVNGLADFIFGYPLPSVWKIAMIERVLTKRQPVITEDNLDIIIALTYNLKDKMDNIPLEIKVNPDIVKDEQEPLGSGDKSIFSYQVIANAYIVISQQTKEQLQLVINFYDAKLNLAKALRFYQIDKYQKAKEVLEYFISHVEVKDTDTNYRNELLLTSN